MKKVTKEFEVFEFNELSEEAKEKVREQQAEILNSWSWWEPIGEGLGFTVEEFDLYRNYAKVEFNHTPVESAKLIIKELDPKSKIVAAAEDYLKKYEAAIKRQEEGEKIKDPDEAMEEVMYGEDDEREADSNFCYAVNEFAFKCLQEDYDYMLSDECLEENAEINDYKYLKDGSLFY